MSEDKLTEFLENLNKHLSLSEQRGDVLVAEVKELKNKVEKLVDKFDSMGEKVITLTGDMKHYKESFEFLQGQVKEGFDHLWEDSREYQKGINDLLNKKLGEELEIKLTDKINSETRKMNLKLLLAICGASGAIILFLIELLVR